MVDLRIRANQSFIATLGGWVRQYEELRLGPAAFLGWEAFLADELLSRAYYPALRVSGQVLTVVLFGVTASIFLLGRAKQPVSLTALVSGVSAVLSILLMTASTVDLRRTNLSFYLYMTLGVTAALLAGLLAYLSTKQRPVGED